MAADGVPIDLNDSNRCGSNLFEAEMLDAWIQNSSLSIIDGAGHTFNTSHPWGESDLPREMEDVKDLLLKGLA